MILIALSFIYITLIILPQGVALQKLAGLNTYNFSVTALMGLLSTTLLTSVWAVFYRVNIEFHITYLLLSCLLAFFYKKEIIAIYSNLACIITALPLWLKWVTAINTLLIIAQCASSPYTVDNESYYIQTIKWLNEYGFVKGLGNLHLFLAQTSGWHVTQSALNFSFAYKNFNDLSGYCLLLGNLFCFQKLHEYIKGNNFSDLVIGIFPLGNVLLFQFISSPSPDIPVYILSFIIFSLYLNQDEIKENDVFKLICLLTLFALFIKITAITLLLLPIFMLAINFKRLAITLPKLAFWGAAVLALFCIKNSIITGYPLFPVTAIDFNYNWSMPGGIADIFFDKGEGFLIKQEQYEKMNYIALFKHWLTMPKLHGLFSKVIIVLLVVTPFLIYKYKNQYKLWVLYGLMAVHMIFLFFTSPQYRFFIHFLLLFVFFATALFINKKAIIILTPTSILLISILLLLPVGLGQFTNNKMMQNNSTFSFKYIFSPHQNSRFGQEFKIVKEGNMEYNSPVGHKFIWSSGNGDLPCVNQKQIKYFKKRYHIVPQLRHATLSGGFYAKEINE